MTYFHPWEIDPGQPRISAPLKSRLRHYTNLRQMEGKVGDFAWGRMDSLVETIRQRGVPYWDSARAKP